MPRVRAADLDRRLNQIDTAIKEAGKHGRPTRRFPRSMGRGKLVRRSLMSETARPVLWQP
jgi:hypothetical protein